MAKTRKKKEIFLLKSISDKLNDNQLPSNKDILEHYYFLKSENPKIKDNTLLCCGFSQDFKVICEENCQYLVKKVTAIYEKAGVPTSRVDKVQKKMSELLAKHKKLISLQKRQNTKEVEKRMIFKDNILSVLFDVTPFDVIKILEKDKKRSQVDKAEDIIFINDQRSCRKMYIGKKDKRYIYSAQRSQQARVRMSGADHDQSYQSELQVSSSGETEISSEETDTSNSTDLSKDEIDPQPSTSAGIVGDTVLISKVKHVSIRAQSDILKQVADTSGLSSKGMSKSNIHRIGRKVIQETAEEAREALRAKAGLNMILHYDGKLVKEYTDGKKLKRERLALSVTCDREHFLLGVPPVADSIGACQTEKIIEILEENSLKEDIKGLVFDTTASNIDKEKGVNFRLNILEDLLCILLADIMFMSFILRMLQSSSGQPQVQIINSSRNCWMSFLLFRLIKINFANSNMELINNLTMLLEYP